MANPNAIPPIHGQWKPGQSGNPRGPLPKKLYREALQAALRKLSESGDPQQTAEEIATAHIVKAKDGDMSAIKEFADRIDGKVPQAIGGTDELPAIKGFAWLEPSE